MAPTTNLKVSHPVSQIESMSPLASKSPLESNDSQGSSELQQLKTLLSGILLDTQNLLAQELELAKLQITQSAQATRQAATELALVVALFVTAAVLLLVSCVQWLTWYFQIPAWCSSALTACITLSIATVAYQQYQSRHSVPFTNTLKNKL